MRKIKKKKEKISNTEEPKKLNKLKMTDILIVINLILIALNYFVFDGNATIYCVIIILTMYVLYLRIREIKNKKGWE